MSRRSASASASSSSTPIPSRPAPANLKKGDVVTGTVTTINDGGIEVTLRRRPCPASSASRELSRDRSEQRPDRFAVGEKVDAKVTAIDPATRKVTLSIKAREVEEEKQAMSRVRLVRFRRQPGRHPGRGPVQGPEGQVGGRRRRGQEVQEEEQERGRGESSPPRLFAAFWRYRAARCPRIGPFRDRLPPLRLPWAKNRSI